MKLKQEFDWWWRGAHGLAMLGLNERAWTSWEDIYPPLFDFLTLTGRTSAIAMMNMAYEAFCDQDRTQTMADQLLAIHDQSLSPIPQALGVIINRE